MKTNRKLKERRKKTKRPGKSLFALLCVIFFVTLGFYGVRTFARRPDIVLENSSRDASPSVSNYSDSSRDAGPSVSNHSDSYQDAGRSTSDHSDSRRNNNSQNNNGQNNGDQNNSSQIIVYFIDVGQGDASLVLCDGHAMMIDGGQSRRSDKIYAFLKDKGVTHLDYIVATHPDDDHIGGLAGALNYATVDAAWSPVTSDDSQAFRSFKKYLDRQNVEITVPEAGDQYPLGDSTITVLGPIEITDSDNNNSVVLKIDHGKNSFLFTGDAEKKEENDILSTAADLNSTVIKIGHHGSVTSTGEDFLAAVNPAAAVITCGIGNEYGHPTEEVLERLRSKEIQVFRTDFQGDITIFENKGSLFYEVEKNPDADVFKPGEIIAEEPQPVPLQEIEDNEDVEDKEDSDLSGDQSVTKGTPESSAPQKHEMDYIVNMKTGKFHYPDCRGVRQMNEANKKYVTCDRQELLDQGYESCGICHP